MSGEIIKATIDLALEQINKCGFECEGGPLYLNTGWIALLDHIEELRAENADLRGQLAAEHYEKIDRRRVAELLAAGFEMSYLDGTYEGMYISGDLPGLNVCRSREG